MHRQITNKQGFTLIEVLIALTILSIGVLAVAAMQIGAIKGNTSASGLTEASTLAQDKLEELLGVNYDDPVISDVNGDGTGQDTDNDGIDNDGGNFGLHELNHLSSPDFPDDSPDYPWQYTGPTGIQYGIAWNIAVDLPVTETKTIKVNVSWFENGRWRLVSLNAVKDRG